MLVHWCYLNFGKIGNSSISEFITRFSPEDSLGILIKSRSIQNLWDVFSSEEKYRHLTHNEPSKVLFEFQERLHSKYFLEMISLTLAQDKVINYLLRSLSKKQVSDFLDKAVLISENKIFCLEDNEFIQVVVGIFH